MSVVQYKFFPFLLYIMSLYPSVDIDTVPLYATSFFNGFYTLEFSFWPASESKKCEVLID
jgi:hypothetical protein